LLSFRLSSRLKRLLGILKRLSTTAVKRSVNSLLLR
jgi:hypothetical protein